MPQKFKSRPDTLLDSLKSKKKTIVCLCWQGIYEAAYRLLHDYTKDSITGKKLSMSRFINIIICAEFCHTFGEFPESEL